ncbi:hypothetical protein, partial [Escherichia coli]|uniref:hypothetical protein n=1 Tax=Escherichia coli TaxID=562 RepID=UPI00158FBDDF
RVNKKKKKEKKEKKREEKEKRKVEKRKVEEEKEERKRNEEKVFVTRRRRNTRILPVGWGGRSVEETGYENRVGVRGRLPR